MTASRSAYFTHGNYLFCILNVYFLLVELIILIDETINRSMWFATAIENTTIIMENNLLALSKQTGGALQVDFPSGEL